MAYPAAADHRRLHGGRSLNQIPPVMIDQHPELHDLAILFLHHRLDPVTLNNLASFQRCNPQVPIVTISGDERMPGGVAAEDLPRFQRLRRYHEGTDWMYRSGLDVMLADWYPRRTLHARRWFLAEWDGWCGLPVREFLREVWDADVAVPSVRWPNREPEWHWFQQALQLPPEYRPYMVGTVPTCFTMLSDRAFQAVADRLKGAIASKIIYEIRIPTLAHAAGYAPVAIPRAGWNVSWQEIPEGTPLSPNLWHSVKWLVPAAEPQSFQTAGEPSSMVPRVEPWVPIPEGDSNPFEAKSVE